MWRFLLPMIINIEEKDLAKQILNMVKSLTTANLAQGGELNPAQKQEDDVDAVDQPEAQENEDEANEDNKWPDAVKKLPKEARDEFIKAYEATEGNNEAKLMAGWKAVKRLFKRNGEDWVKKDLLTPIYGDVDQLYRQLLTDGYPEAADSVKESVAMGSPVMLDPETLPPGYRDIIADRYGTARKDNEAGESEPFSVEVAFKALLDEKKVTYGVVYPVDEVDLQKEWAKADTIEKAAHNFMANYRQHDTFHNEHAGAGVPVESFIAPCDLHEFHGKQLPPDQVIKKGSWVMATKWTDESWKLVKEGKIRGYSIGGFKRVRR